MCFQCKVKKLFLSEASLVVVHEGTCIKLARCTSRTRMQKIPSWRDGKMISMACYLTDGLWDGTSIGYLMSRDCRAVWPLVKRCFSSWVQASQVNYKIACSLLQTSLLL